MLKAQHTPNMTGVLITGDFDDFYELYEALHKIVGDIEESGGYYPSGIRVLGFCYDLRHAFMGHRNAGFKEHGLNEEQMQFLSLVGPKENLYLSFETLWPEMFFIVFSLENFIEQYKLREKTHLWDENIAAVRKLQATIARLVEETLTPNKFAMFKKWMQPNYGAYYNYYTQFVDYLNDKWINMDAKKREKNFNIYAKRLAETSVEYLKQKKEIDEVALEDGVSPMEIQYIYDDESPIKW